MAALPVPSRDADVVRQFHRVRLARSRNKNEVALLELWHDGNDCIVRQTMGNIGGVGKFHIARMVGSNVKVIIAALVQSGFDEVELAARSHPAAAVVEAPQVAQLFAWIMSEADRAIKQTFGSNLSGISLSAIDRGRVLLREVDLVWQAYMRNPGPRSQVYAPWRAVTAAVENFYRAVPSLIHERHLDDIVVHFVSDLHEAEEQLDRLAGKIQQDIAPAASGIAGVTIDYLDEQDAERVRIARWIEATVVHDYGIRVRDVYRVCIASERAAFEARQVTQHNVVELVHGTKTANMRHILPAGLIVPKIAANGRAFGDGIYFARHSSKSANYCSSAHPSTPLMLLVGQVDIGRAYETTGSVRVPPVGYDSVIARSGGALKWDEFIVYRQNQQTITHLITFDKTHR